MRKCARISLHRTAATIAVLTAAVVAAACGVSSPRTPLPDIDHSRPATMLNAKQKSKALEQMGRIADQQSQAAAKITPITYKIPQSAP